MEASTTIRRMLAGNKIAVPSYQRAYSWDTPDEKSGRNTHTAPYYFGHFLFERRSNEEFYVIDGQQRLTTIVIFLSALFAKLKTRSLKAYRYNLPINQTKKLCSSLESLILRHRLVGTRADVTSRINDVFEGFTESNKSIDPIICRMKRLKKAEVSSEWWWAYWNDENLKASLKGKVNHSVAKYLLWKYEIHLGRSGTDGYLPPRFDSIISPELEHIAPLTEPDGKPHGYDDYDDVFKNQYLDCLGNYLLLSKSHNCKVGNRPFAEKRETYKHTAQQREIQRMVPATGVWNKETIERRQDKIVQFILETF